MREPFYHIDTFKPRISVGYLLRHTSKLCGARIETMFDDADVSFTQWIALALIHGEIADTCSRLARDIGHNTGAMTRVLDQLVERGLVRRERDELDRRVSKLILTSDGEATVRRLAVKVVDYWNDLLADFERHEIETVIDVLTRLSARMEQMETPAEVRLS